MEQTPEMKNLKNQDIKKQRESIGDQRAEARNLRPWLWVLAVLLPLLLIVGLGLAILIAGR